MIFLTFIILNNWSPDTLIAEGYTSYPNQNNIVCDANGDVHISWFKWNGGSSYSTYYQHYTGTQWIGYEDLSTGITQSFNYLPSITNWSSGTGDLYLYALWQTNWVSHRGEGYFRITLRKFSSTGEWEDTIAFVSSDSMDAFAPCAVCDYKGVVHIVWEQGYEICYRNLTVFGFSDEIFYLSNSGVYTAYPAIATFEEKLFVVWEDLRDGNFEIYFKEFDGNKWSDDKRVTNSTSASLFPSLCVDSTGIVHIVWQEDAIGGYKIFYTNYTQGNFDTPSVAVESPSEAMRSSIVSDGEKIHLVWSDSRDGDWEIYYKVKSQKLKVKSEWEAPARLTYSSGVSADPSISADKDGNLYLLFWDTRDGKAKIYFKKKELKNTRTQEHKSINLVISPNPFTQKTVIHYSLNANRTIHDSRFTIYDLSGRLIREFPMQGPRLTAHEVVWDGKDANGVELNSGIYFLKIENQELKKKIVEKIILIR
ncbi:T9SS type A sorting domain-containing protein [candidate division WOR-3 bacterium]|nr:T9SS type A sorting domain-containing protein [candidate division WOR-3 bacterium]